MKKAQWRMLMTELLEIHNLLKDIQARLPPVPDIVSCRTGLPVTDLDYPIIASTDGAPTYLDLELGKSSKSLVDYTDLRTYEIMPDGTRQECEP